MLCFLIASTKSSWTSAAVYTQLKKSINNWCAYDIWQELQNDLEPKIVISQAGILTKQYTTTKMSYEHCCVKHNIVHYLYWHLDAMFS